MAVRPAPNLLAGSVIPSKACPMGLFTATREKEPTVTRVAILIDGGFPVKRLASLHPEFDIGNPVEAANAINRLQKDTPPTRTADQGIMVTDICE